MPKLEQLFAKSLVTAFAGVVVTFSALTAQADDFLDTLRIGSVVYSNVTVFNKTPEDIYYKHSFGFGNAKVRDLDRPLLLKLGYELPPEEGASPSVFDQSMLESSAVTNLVADPRFQELQALVNEHMGDVLDKVTPEVIYGITGGVIALYLFYCFCARLICVKATPGGKVSPLIWVPILQQIPLLRAAGLPGWWFLTVILPPIWCILHIYWSFRIAQARGKSWVVGVLLLLPVTNVFAFLYLAFAGDGKVLPPSSNVISLGGPPRRAVA